MRWLKTLLTVFLLLNVPGWAQSDYELSYLLIRSDSGEVLARQEEFKPRTPASTMKLVTAAAALERLGAEHRYRTTVWAEEKPARGRLSGDLALKGEADPELNQASLEALAEQLKSTGLRRVSGDLIVDEGEFAFPPYGPGWAWDDAGSSYAPEVTGLALDRGVIGFPSDHKAHWLKRQSSEIERVSLIPGRAGVVMEGPAPSALAPPWSALRTGERFVEILRQKGIVVRGEVRLGVARGEIVARHQSASLEEILRRGMASSDNLALELIYRSSGGCLPHSLEQEKLRQVDGSGLSRYNLISSAQLVKLLRVHPELKGILPGPGEGTLKNRFRSGSGKLAIKAKTGTLGNVSGLAGYLYPDTPQEMTFAILINAHLDTTTARKSIEDDLVMRWLHDYSRL